METLKFGLIGASRIAGGALVPALEKAHNAVAWGVAARDPQKAKEFALEHGVPHAFSSYDELLSSPEIEAVYISLPNSDHKEWTIKALEAGKHVICEKALALNAAEVLEMADASRRTGKLLLEGFMWRFHPQVLKALELMPQLGELRHIAASFSFMLERPEDIRWVRSLGGGAIFDVGCYTVCAARTFAGREPVAVTAWTEESSSESFGASLGRGVDTRMVALLDFGGGLKAQLDCAITQPVRQRLELVGATGTLVLETPFVPGRSQAERLPNGSVGPRVLLSGEPVEVEAADQYQLMVEHFVEAARGEVALRYPLEDAIGQATVLDQIFTSARG